MQRRSFLRRAAALGLSLVPPGTSVQAASATAEVSGHVVSRDQPLRGVRVSDGYRVVLTDDHGQFRLPIDRRSGPYLFVVTPRGYWTDRFYVPTSAAVVRAPVFRLEARDVTDTYQTLYLPDIHLGEGDAEQSFERFRATIDEINRMDRAPAFCWMGGDITLQGGKGRRYVEMMANLRVPVRHAVGNHEMLVREPDPRGEFLRLFGPTYYSWDVGRVHYITLDGCRLNLEFQDYRNVEGWLSPRELEWLASDLRHVPDGYAIVVAIHIPLVTDYPQRRGTTADRVPYWVVKNAQEVIDLLAAHGVRIVLQGHLHENRRLEQHGIEFVESISVSGRWWKAAAGAREHGVSGEPRGYRVLEVRGDRMDHRYQATAESRVDAIGEIVGRPEQLPAEQDAQLGLNIFDPPDGATVAARIDDSPFQELRPASDYSYHSELQAAHHWAWHLPAERLRAGRHRLEVRLCTPSGQEQLFRHELRAV